MNTKENFVNVLVECQGIDVKEAMETAIEYKNNLEDYIRSCGGGNNAIEECKAYLGLANKAI